MPDTHFEGEPEHSLTYERVLPELLREIDDLREENERVRFEMGRSSQGQADEAIQRRIRVLEAEGATLRAA